jgi:hypothetical protein
VTTRASTPRTTSRRWSATRDGILERHFYSRFLGINSSLLRLEFLSSFLPSFFLSTKCYSQIDSVFLFCRFLKPELKWVWHEIFDLSFFSWISVPWAPE